MRDPRISFKSPLAAGVLALAMPGAGHWYQGRRFKATLFSSCILLLYFWGLLIGNLQPVYSQIAHPKGRGTSIQLEKGPPAAKMTFAYGAQALVGIPALPAFLQQLRFKSDAGVVEFLTSSIQSDFVGVVRERSDGLSSVARTVRGQVLIEPANSDGSRVVTGTLKGQFDDGTDVELPLGGEIRLGREVYGSPNRELICSVMDPAGSGAAVGSLEGSIHRSMVNWFQAPRDSNELDRLHGKLGRRFDIATVFTWIAGLLNLLVIWDAIEGPAYGYGDEKTEEGEAGKAPAPPE
ncbi:MAG: hypothetical protein KDA91_18920 [Planctomycetaceae bacterium]|nr:hypothetical protein [Planctomycetaceae bacterium]